MQHKDFDEIIGYIVNESIKLKNKYTYESKIPIEFACIFSRDNREYEDLIDTIKKLGSVVQGTPSGYTYQLYNPIKTNAGILKLVKIRKPDPLRKERGDTDFNTNYFEFKIKYQKNKQFELVERNNFEMLRLSDPKYDV